jgi:hypothetical protein
MPASPRPEHGLACELAEAVRPDVKSLKAGVLESGAASLNGQAFREVGPDRALMPSKFPGAAPISSAYFPMMAPSRA